jgi:hypothetical protein
MLPLACPHLPLIPPPHPLLWPPQVLYAGDHIYGDILRPLFAPAGPWLTPSCGPPRCCTRGTTSTGTSCAPKSPSAGAPCCWWVTQLSYCPHHACYISVTPVSHCLYRRRYIGVTPESHCPHRRRYKCVTLSVILLVCDITVIPNSKVII